MRFIWIFAALLLTTARADVYLYQQGVEIAVWHGDCHAGGMGGNWVVECMRGNERKRYSVETDTDTNNYIFVEKE